MTTIFISIPWFHPAYKAGGPVQSIANMVNELKEGYRFYIFCGNADLDGLPLHITKTSEWVSYNAHTQVWYATRQERSQQLTEQVAAITPDIIYMVGMYSWHFTMVPLFFCKGPAKILSARGMLHPGALGEKAFKKKVFLQLMQWAGLVKKTTFHATDEQEMLHIRNTMGEDARVAVAGNFARAIERLQLPVKIVGQLKLLSIALISPMKNILLVLQALESCTAAISYDIYGPVKDVAYWEQCLQQIKLLPSNISVQYHRDLNPVQVPIKLATAQVFILPSKSENFGHAVYEALSAGMPVITSDFTPWNGLQAATAGMNVATEAIALAAAISTFAAMDADSFLHWKTGANAYAAAHMNKQQLQVDYQRLFQIQARSPN